MQLLIKRHLSPAPFSLSDIEVLHVSVPEDEPSAQRLQSTVNIAKTALCKLTLRYPVSRRPTKLNLSNSTALRSICFVMYHGMSNLPSHPATVFTDPSVGGMKGEEWRHVDTILSQDHFGSCQVIISFVAEQDRQLHPAYCTAAAYLPISCSRGKLSIRAT
ncbi:hypothetical protein DXG01_003314 [Tephrocybe rancida]|nr:hypothetical protein DXG01_003314 [Tephrocybe rancida]